MPVTEVEVKQQIILEVGDVDPENGDPPVPASAGIVASRIDYLWERFAAWDQVRIGLRELYCRQSAIRLVLGVLAPRRFDSTDSRAGLSLRAHQLVDSYQDMLETVTKDIETLKKTPGGAVGTGVGTGYRSSRLVTTSPVSPITWPPNPNAMRYGGTVNGIEPPPPEAP